MLCPTGDSAVCPHDEQCYAGISCATSNRDMEDVMEEQRRLEREELNRLMDLTDDEYVNRFVCGHSYEDAMSSCATSADPPQRHPQHGWVASTAYYCPTGSSLVCPADQECYAAVTCPETTHALEMPRLELVEVGLNLQSVVTEPMLMNYSDTEIIEVMSLGMNVDTESILKWSSWMIGC